MAPVPSSGVPRILYGLDRIPSGASSEDRRLPGADLRAHPLRLNSEAFPSQFASGVGSGHEERWAACRGWVESCCGDYAVHRRRFIGQYLDFVERHIERNHAEIEAICRQFDGIYRRADWLWSALRPLPRAWLSSQGKWIPADVMLWDGTELVAVSIGQSEEHNASLAIAGARVVHLDPKNLPGDPESVMPRILGYSGAFFWRSESLPMSPFREPIRIGAER